MTGTDGVKKPVGEIQYGYDSSTAKAGEAASQINVPESSSPTLEGYGKDEVSSAKEKLKAPVITSKTDSASNPILNPRAVQNIEVRNQLNKEIIATGILRQMITKENVEEADIDTQMNALVQLLVDTDAPETHGNLWLQFPSTMGALYIALIEVAKNMSSSRFLDSIMNRTLEQGMFNVGMQNADLAKKLRYMESNKEMMNAVKNFVMAGISVYQAVSIVSERGRVKEEVDAEADTPGTAANDNKIAQERLADLDKKFGVTDTDPQKKAKLEAALSNASPAEKQEYKEAQRDANRTKQALNEEYHSRVRESQSYQEAKIRALNSFVEGTFGIIIALQTQEIGETEKLKQISETLIQLWSRLYETGKESKNDSLAQLDKIFQMLVQWGNETRARLSTHG